MGWRISLAIILDVVLVSLTLLVMWWEGSIMAMGRIMDASISFIVTRRSRMGAWTCT